MSPGEWLQEQIINSPDEFVKKLSSCQLSSLDDLLPDMSVEWGKQHEATIGALQTAIKPYATVTVNPKKIRAKVSIAGSAQLSKPAKAPSRPGRGKRNSPKYQSAPR